MFTLFLIVIAIILAGVGCYFQIVHEGRKEKEEKEAFSAKIDADRAERLRKFNDEQEAIRLALVDPNLTWETVPFSTRAAHHWIIGRSGHGKTQTLQHLISLDIPKVIMGEMSVVVMDSQSQMIPLLASLDVWKSNHKLVYIDPARDTPPLNLFDVKPGQNLNTVLEAFRFIINSILASSEFTGKQGLLFDMLMQLMLKIEGATIHTLIDLLSDTGIRKYQAEIARLPPSPRKFFETEYIKGGRTDQYKATRDEVSRRLWQILANPTFDTMFSARRMSIDFAREMESGKLILIDTNKSFFAETNSAIIGSLFIGLLYQAILTRNERSKPCIIYIDEVQEYFQHNGSILRSLLEQARKFNVGIVMAHHDLDQLNKSPGLYGALSASTAIKMAGGTSNQDAKTLAPMLATNEEAIFGTKRGEFRTFIPSMIARSQVFMTDFGRIERLPRSTYQPETPEMTLGQKMRAKKREEKLRLLEDKRDTTRAGDY